MTAKPKRKRKTSRKRRRSQNSRQTPETPGWLWGVFGLAVGLSVAAAVYMKDRRADVPVAERSVADPPSVAPAPGDSGGEGALPKDQKDPTEAPSSGGQRFTFYEMLKRSEVVVPEEPLPPGSEEPAAIVEPGTYVLQVGSFSTPEDADSRRAELALQGIESRIQKAQVDDRIYYRVRIGPSDDLDALNLIRSRLNAANIDAVRLREID
jgi:cell division protein FtsN